MKTSQLCGFSVLLVLVVSLPWLLFSSYISVTTQSALPVAEPGRDDFQVNKDEISLLIIRTVGAKEWSLVSKDVRTLSEARFTKGTADTSLCGIPIDDDRFTNKRKGSARGFSPDLSPDGWPSQLVCELHEKSRLTEIRMRISFVLFVYDNRVTEQQISSLVSDVESSGSEIAVHKQHGWSKLQFWFHWVDPSMLGGKDYVWFADGDLLLSEMNWFGWWTHVLHFQPLISQPVILANVSSAKRRQSWAMGSDHATLGLLFDEKTQVWQTDLTLIAAETSIVEIMAPLLTAQAWLTVRKAFLSQPGLMALINGGATWCIDTVWCHIVRKRLLNASELITPDIHFSSVFAAKSKFGRNPNLHQRGWFDDPIHPACLVFYHTPLTHYEYKTMPKGKSFVMKSEELCERSHSEFGGSRNTTWLFYRLFFGLDLDQV